MKQFEKKNQPLARTMTMAIGKRSCLIVTVTSVFFLCVLIQMYTMRCFLKYINTPIVEQSQTCSFIQPLYSVLFDLGWKPPQSDARKSLQYTKPLIPILPQDQIIYVSDNNSTVNLIGSLPHANDHWLCRPESECVHISRSRDIDNQQYEFFEVKVDVPILDIYVNRINTEVEQLEKFHHIQFQYL